MTERSATRVVVIVGMHRSGTSLLARLLAALGVTFGSRVMTDPVSDNQGGYWEHADIVTAQETLLEDVLDRPWHRARGLDPLPVDWWRSAEVLPYRLALTETLQRECAAADGIFGFKDPRTARLLPLWLDIFRETGIEPVFVLATRAPDAVAGSLRRRQQVPRALGRLLWLQHTFDAVRELDGAVRTVVDYDRLVADPGSVLPRLVRILDLPDPGESRLDEAVSLIDQALRHHISEPCGSDTWTDRAHALLAGLEGDGRFPAALLEMAASFHAMQPLLAASARELETACGAVAACGESARQGARDAASARQAATRMEYLGFREVWPRDAALLAPVQDELAAARRELAAVSQDQAATRQFLFDQLSRFVSALAPGQRDLLLRPTGSARDRLGTARELLAQLRGYRSWRIPLALMAPAASDAAVREPRDEHEAVDQIVSVLVSRRWRYTWPLRWIEDLRRRRGQTEQSPAGTEQSPDGEERRSRPDPREAPYSRLYLAWAARQTPEQAVPNGSAGTVMLLASPGDDGAAAPFSAMLDTLRRQTWTDWRLIVCLDGEAVLPDAVSYREDPRIRILEDATRESLDAALGEADRAWEWIGWVRATDIYEPDALAAALVAAGAQHDLVYSDFDRSDGWGVRHAPTFLSPPVAHVPFMAARLGGLALVSRKVADRAGIQVCSNPADLVRQHVAWCRCIDVSRICHVPRALVHRSAVPSAPPSPGSVFAVLRLDELLGQYGWRVAAGPNGLAEGPGLGVEPLPPRGIRAVVFVVNGNRAAIAPWMTAALRDSLQTLEIVVLGMPAGPPIASDDALSGLLHVVEPGGSGACGEIVAWLERAQPDVAVVIDAGCWPAHADALSELIALAAASGIEIAGGAVRQQAVLGDGFRSTNMRSRYLFPRTVDPRCFAFRSGAGGPVRWLRDRDTIQHATEAMCADAAMRRAAVVVSRDAEFVCGDEARTADYSIEEQMIVDWSQH